MGGIKKRKGMSTFFNQDHETGYYSSSDEDDDDDEQEDNKEIEVDSQSGIKNIISAFCGGKVRVFSDTDGTTFSIPATQCKPIEIVAGLKTLYRHRGPWCVSMGPTDVRFIDFGRLSRPMEGVQSSIRNLVGVGPLTREAAAWVDSEFDDDPESVEYVYMPTDDKKSYKVKKHILYTTNHDSGSGLYKFVKSHVIVISLLQGCLATLATLFWLWQSKD